MNDVGRPSKYTPELADKICARLAQGESLRTVTKSEDLPCAATVFNWLRIHDEFLEQYERAKQESADALADEVLDIADNGMNDWMEYHDKEGNCIGWKLNGEHVQRSRLRIDTRKFLMSKMKPKKYGDKITNEHVGEININNKVTVEEAKELDLAKLREIAGDKVVAINR